MGRKILLLLLIPVALTYGKAKNLLPVFGNVDQEGWQRSSKALGDAIDESADPCNDFFLFACGNWVKSHQLKQYETKVNQFAVLQNQVSQTINNIMDKTDINSARHAIKQAKIYYDMCMKPTPSASRTEDLQKVLKLINLYGGWPALERAWKGPVGGKDIGSVAALHGYLYGQLAVDSILGIVIAPDRRHSDRRVPVLDATSKVYFPNFPDVSADFIHLLMEAVAWASNLHTNPFRFHRDARKIVEIELKFKDAIGKRASMADLGGYLSMNRIPYNTFNMSELTQRWPALDWKTYLTFMAKDNDVEPKNLFDAFFVIPYPESIDKVQEVIKSTSDRDMQNFLIWRLVLKAVSQIPSTVDLSNQFYMVQNRVYEAPPKWSKCGRAVTMDTNLGQAASRPFVDYWRAKNPNGTTEEVAGMIDNILQAFRGMIDELKWMDDKSKKGAHAKVDNLEINTGYPLYLLDDDLLDEIYSELQLSPFDDDYTTVLKQMRFQASVTVRKINTPVDRHSDSFEMSAAVVNAWYIPLLNSITFPAAILQEPFFGAYRPKAVNYGAIGAVMGHELTHGFDNNGVQWDSHGLQEMWMDDKSYQGFLNMAQCVVDQYGDVCYTDIGNCVDSTLTEGENIADNGGLMASYRAYQELVHKNGPEPRLPGKMKKYTMNQVFFMSFAHNYCSRVTPTSIERQLVVDPHSPDRVRATETLKNIPQFAEAFKCKPGSNMAPVDHCDVWVKQRVQEKQEKKHSLVKYSYIFHKKFEVAKPERITAKAVIFENGKQDGKPMGIIELVQESENTPVKVSGTLNLPKGIHGFHIHELGKTSPDCKAAGGHYNPEGHHHAGPFDRKRHVGDLGNVAAGPKGIAKLYMSDKVISLIGEHSIIGRSVVVHQKRDDLGRGNDEESLKTGNAGARIGCGVIVLSGDNYY